MSQTRSVRAAARDTLNRIAGRIPSLLAVTYVLLASFPGDIIANQPGLDNSWMYALNFANAHNLVHGRDLAFTYGPLGYAAFPIAGTSTLRTALAAKLLAHLALAALLVAFCLDVPKKAPMVLCLAGFVCALAFFGSFGIVGNFSLDIVLLLVTALGVGKAVTDDRARTWFLAIGAVAAAASLFVKFSTGVAATGMLVVCFLILLRRRERRSLVMLSCTAYIIATVVLAAILIGSTSDVLRWVRASIEFSRGYSGAMVNPSILSNTLLGIGLLLLYGLFASLQLVWGTKTGPLALVLALPVFVGFKAGMVRQDEGHEALFYLLLCLVACVLIVNAERARDVALSSMLCTSFILAGLLARTHYPDAQLNWPLPIVEVVTLQRGLSNLRTLFYSMADPGKETTGTLEALRIRGDWVEEVRNSAASIGVLPSEINYALANGLGWAPIPTMQAYASYTPWLDRWNSTHISDIGGPKYFLVSHTSIDNRYPLWDMPLAWRAILARYDVRDLDAGSKLILLRRTMRHDAPLTDLEGGTIRPREWVPVRKAATPVYVEIDMSLTLGGRVRESLYRLTPIIIELRFESGHESSFRVPPANVLSGLLINYVPESVEDLVKLFRCEATDRVESFRISGRGADFLVPNIRVIWKAASLPCGDVRLMPSNNVHTTGNGKP